ncbi:SCP-like protein, partial [Ancylostoma caninum]
DRSNPNGRLGTYIVISHFFPVAYPLLFLKSIWLLFLVVMVTVGISLNAMWKCHSSFVILAFGCTNNLITDKWREAVLNRHNTLRKRLAEGKQQGKGVVLKAAANMNKLNWDCNMETLVDENIEKCSAPAAPPQNTYAMTSAEIPIRGECNAVNLVEEKLKAWWKEGASEMTDNTVKADNPFAQMANAKADGFACSYKRCQGKLFLLCFYNQKAPAATNPLYEAVAQAGDQPCGNCAKYPPPPDPNGKKVECLEALCQFPLTEAKIPSTVCGNPPCVGEFSDEFRLAALDMHNYYRRLLATGWAKDKQITYAKPGVKMIELEYDKSLEDKAITEANKCPTKAAGGAGESVWAVKDWWAPVEETGFGSSLEYTADTASSTLKYAANIAYEATTKIGCAVKNCPPQGVTVVDCHYSPAIAEGDTIYTTGNKPCSKCRDVQGKTACSTLGGLCVKP